MVEIIRFLFKFAFVRFVLKLAVFMLALISFMVSKILTYELEYRESWEKITGTVTKSAVAKRQTANIYYVDLAYSYTFNGKDYNATDNINKSTLESRIKEVVAEYPVGAKIDVFVNPDDNSERYVIMGEDIGHNSMHNVKIFFYAATFGLIISIILLFKGPFIWLFKVIKADSILKLLKKVLDGVIISKEPRNVGGQRDGGTIKRSRNI